MIRKLLDLLWRVLPLLVLIYYYLLQILDKWTPVVYPFYASVDEFRSWYPHGYLVAYFFFRYQFAAVIVAGVAEIIIHYKSYREGLRKSSGYLSLFMFIAALVVFAVYTQNYKAELTLYALSVLSGFSLQYLAQNKFSIPVLGKVSVYFLRLSDSILNAADYQKSLLKNGVVTVAYTLLFVAAYYFLETRNFYSETAFFKAQLLLTHAYLLLLCLHFFLVVYLNRDAVFPFLKGFFSEPGSAYNLAIFRIVIGYYLWGVYRFNGLHNAYWASLPDDMRVSLPYMGWFIQNVPISPEIYSTATYIGAVVAFCIMAGAFTRVALIINIPLSIYILGVPFFYGKLFHMHIWVWFPAILAFSPCADVLSLDWLIKKLRYKSNEITFHAKYRLPLSFVWLHLGIIYFFAGIIKLVKCGFAWALSDSMVNQLHAEWAQWYNQIPGVRLDHYPALLHFGGVAVILFEIFYVFLIFSTIGRIIVFAGGLLMHNLIAYLMYIGFEDLQTTYVSLLNWHSIGDRLRGIFSGRSIKLTEGPGISQLFKLRSYKYVFITGAALFTINSIFGFFQIHSWPFSSYPTYSDLVPAYRHYIYFEAYNNSGIQVDVFDAGNRAKFRMESYTPVEDRIYESMTANDSDAIIRGVNKLWDIWRANVPALKEVDSVVVYMRTSPVAPEKVHIISEEKYLMTLKF